MKGGPQGETEIVKARDENERGADLPEPAHPILSTPAREQHGAKKRQHDTLMANFDTDAECGDGGNDGGARKASHGIEESAGKTEAMKKTEAKRNGESRPAAGLAWKEKILRGYGDDAERDHGLHQAAGEMDPMQRGEAERDRVSEGKGGDDGDKVPEAGDSEDERGYEQKMVPSSEDVPHSVFEVIASNAAFRQHRRVVETADTEPNRLLVGEQETLGEGFIALQDAGTESGLPRIARSELDFVEQILFDDKRAQLRAGSREWKAKQVNYETLRGVLYGRNNLGDLPSQRRAVRCHSHVCEHVAGVLAPHFIETGGRRAVTRKGACDKNLLVRDAEARLDDTGPGMQFQRALRDGVREQSDGEREENEESATCSHR